MAQHLPLPYKGKRGGTGWQGTGPGDRTSALLPSFTDRYADTRIQETGRTIIDHRYIGRYTPFIPVQASRRHPPPANKHDTRRYSRPSPAEDTNGTERIEFESMERMWFKVCINFEMEFSSISRQRVRRERYSTRCDKVIELLRKWY